MPPVPYPPLRGTFPSRGRLTIRGYRHLKCGEAATSTLNPEPSTHFIHKEHLTIMNYSNIKEYDIANGPGIRYTLFVSGCTHHCKGCFNPETWDFAHGKPFTKDIEDHILEEVGQEYYEGLTLLGGEPMEPSNQKGLLSLVTRFKERYPQKTIWCFSGYLFDRDLLGHFAKVMPETMELLKRIDVLVDGEFMLDKKDVTLLFKGSSNQRTIDVPKSLAAGKIIAWDPRDTSMSPNSKI